MPVRLVDRLTVAQVLLKFFPSKVSVVATACVDAVGSTVADHSHCVEVEVAADLHVAEEFVRTSKLGSWQIL